MSPGEGLGQRQSQHERFEQRAANHPVGEAAGAENKEKPSKRRGSFERGGLRRTVREDEGQADNTDVFVPQNQFMGGTDTVRDQPGIGIEEPVRACLDPSQDNIIGVAETQIFIVQMNLQPREFLRQLRQDGARIVSRCVVDDVHLMRSGLKPRAVMRGRTNAALDVGSRIERNDDDDGLEHGFSCGIDRKASRFYQSWSFS